MTVPALRLVDDADWIVQECSSGLVLLDFHGKIIAKLFTFVRAILISTFGVWYNHRTFSEAMQMNMKKIVVFSCLAMAALGATQAATYSDMSVDVSNLPKERQVLRSMMLARVWARTLPSPGATLKVRFALDASLPGEEAVVAVTNGMAVVRGGRFRSLVFGAGVLLRAIRYGADLFELADGELRFSPANPYRIAYLGISTTGIFARARTNRYGTWRTLRSGE